MRPISFRRTASCVLVATVALFSIMLTPVAGATEVVCGETLYVDTRLANDLTCSGGIGLVIGADGITVNLAGHTISGPSNPGWGGGIWNDGFEGVTVRNGFITGFYAGVHLGGSVGGVTENQVTGINASGNYIGIYLHENAESNQVRRNTVTNTTTGTYVEIHSHNNLIERNQVEGNGRGLWVSMGSDNNVISRNTVMGSTWQGIGIDTGFGGYATTANVVERNEVTGNETGIFVTAEDTLVSKNTVKENAKDGIFIAAASTGTEVMKNKSHWNGSTPGTWDGIDVDSPDTVVAENRTNFNAQFGISAVPGVTDDGGNRAANNWRFNTQCNNVDCR